MSLAQTSPQVQTIGFNSFDGHYLILDGGQKVTISQPQYFQFLAGMTIEVEPVTPFDAWLAENEDNLDDMADYQSALQMGYSFS